MQLEYKGAVLNRLKTVHGHLDGTIRMIDNDTYCVEVMKRLSALQATAAWPSPGATAFAKHVSRWFCSKSRLARSIDSELVDALKFTPALTGAEFAAGLAEAGRAPATPTSGR